MRKNYFWIFVLCLTALPLLCQAQRDEDDNRMGFNLNKPEREEWLRDLGFGLFIYWSHDSQLGIVIGHSLAGSSDDYNRRYINNNSRWPNPIVIKLENVEPVLK
jgi:alpha-L-fucosidase